MQIKGITRLAHGPITITVDWHQREKENCTIMPTTFRLEQFPPAGYKYLIDFLI